MAELKIYYQDKDIIVVHKPPFIASQDDGFMNKDMVSLIKSHIYETEKRTNPYVGVVHRLDKPVEGIMVYALNTKAAGELSKAIARHEFKKIYKAVLKGDDSELSGITPGEKKMISNTLIKRTSAGFIAENYIRQDKRNNISVVCDKPLADAKKSRLEFEILEKTDAMITVSIRLETGRHHQIRATMADIGLPVSGDKKYGQKQDNTKRTSTESLKLWAYRIVFKHPVTGKYMEFML